MEKEVYWLWFSALKGIGAVKQRELLKHWKDARELYLAKEWEVEKIFKQTKYFTEKDFLEFCQSKKDLSKYRAEWEKLQKQEIEVMSEDNPKYPKKLKEQIGSPTVFFSKGDWQGLENKLCLGIVGTRKASRYGKEIASELGRLCAKYQVVVVSGMAAGIDGEAQRACLRSGGYSAGVLGSGLYHQYPHCNRDLYLDMQKQGILLSEEWYDTPPYGTLFPKRNRIISALSDALIVVEAEKNSGSLITADYALEQGKDIYTVPGRLCDIQSSGCNHLISQGAFILEDLEEFFQQFSGRKNNSEEKNQVADNINEIESKIYACMSFEPIYIGRLLEKTGLEQGELQLSLLQLEWKGYIEQISAGYFVLVRRY